MLAIKKESLTNCVRHTHEHDQSQVPIASHTFFRTSHTHATAAKPRNSSLAFRHPIHSDASAPAVRAGKSLSENEIAATLPTESSAKTGRLLDLAIDSAQAFIGSHTLNIKFPEDTTEIVGRAIEEGRGKIKKLKLVKPIILAVAAKLLALAPLFLGGLVLLATKALFVAKIAFLLAAALGFSKLGGSGASGLLSRITGAGNSGAESQGWSNAGSSQGWSSGNTGGSSQGWSSGASASYPYARSYDVAQEMAYGAQMPQAEQQ